MVNKKKVTLKQLQSRALARRKGQPLLKKIDGLSEFVELLSSKLIKDINDVDQSGGKSLLFLSFWTIKWETKDEGIFFSSNCSSTSSARNISQKFIDSGYKINAKVIDYFYSIITKPPMFIDTLFELSKLAKANKNMMKSDLTSGNHLAYLFNVLFVEIFSAAYSDEIVEIPGLGVFEKTLKINTKTKNGKTPVGYLQFYPDFK